MKLFDYENREGRIDNEKLRSLCIERGWFTCGTNSQYLKLCAARSRVHGAAGHKRSGTSDRVAGHLIMNC